MTAYPFNELLKKSSTTKFELNKDHLETFKTFIDTISSTPVLALPKLDLPHSVDTDTSDYG